MAVSTVALSPARASAAATPPTTDVGEQPHVIVLSHDFGQLRPDERATYVFQITNDTGGVWTVAGITRHCNCAVANLSANRIFPGATEEASLAYRARPKMNDDHRAVEIRFKEPGSPIVRLEVSAAIRPAVVVSSDAVQLRCSGRHSPVKETIDVENYSLADWQQIVVATDEPWLSGVAELVRGDDEPRRARQLWRVQLKADPGALPPGRYSADLRLECRGGDGAASAKLPVGLHVTGPIEFIPEQMFFGNLDRQGEATCAVWIRCLAHKADFVASNLVFEHDLGDWLVCEVALGANDRLELRGRVHVPNVVETASGMIKLSLKWRRSGVASPGCPVKGGELNVPIRPRHEAQATHVRVLVFSRRDTRWLMLVLADRQPWPSPQRRHARFIRPAIAKSVGGAGRVICRCW